jgi:hypothetical protein
VLQAALKSGLTEVKHPGHPYYFVIPDGPSVHHRANEPNAMFLFK